MSQEGDFHHPIHDLIRERWSPRAFSDRPVEREKIIRILEAARWAPSCFNEQPWSFFITTREDVKKYEDLLSCLVEGNRVWAQKAPVLMLSVARKNFTRNDKPNRHAFHDVGLAAGNLLLQATHEGLYVHQMAGFEVDQARTLLEIPEPWEPVAMMAMGYLGRPEGLPEGLKERELQRRTRKSLNECVFSGKWAQTSVWLK